MAIINGWGRGTWGEGAFSEELPVNLSSAGAITSAIGSVTVDAEANATLTTLAITSGLGSVTTEAKANVTPATQVITSGLGSPAIDAEANTTLGTLAITSAIGSVIVFENEVINMPSFAITSAISTATSTTAAANVVPTGVSITFTPGSIFIWGEVDDSQTPNYSDVATSQTPNYTSITAGRDAA